MSMKDFRQK